MQTVGPYRIGQALGTCPVGGVWSAVDAVNNPVTVAMLTGGAATDPGWRRAFAATATALAQSRQVPLIAADYSGPVPWIASAARDGSVLGQVFTALGMDYQPAAEPGQHLATQPSPREERPGLAPEPTQGAEEPTHRVSVGQPTSPAAWQPPRERAPAAASSQENPLMGLPQTASPFGAPPPAPPRKRSRKVLVPVMMLIIGLLLGGGLAAIALWPNDGEPRAQQSTEPPTPEPTLPSPSLPGVEPPQSGEWPADWPAFAPDEPTSQMVGPIGDDLARAFLVPAGWDCPTVTVEGTFAHYTCGPDGDATEVGGDLILRRCPAPCDGDRRVQMRAEIDAWGVQWAYDTPYRVWAESDEIDGGERYGLVVVAYYQTEPQGELDRQLVLRISGSVDQADELRKIANSVRDAVA